MSEQPKRGATPPGDAWDNGVYVRHDDPPAVSQQDSEDPSVARVNRPGEVQDIFRDEEDDEDIDMSVAELLYSTSSFYAIVIPGMDFHVKLITGSVHYFL
jgi:hypothetical protein